MLELKAKIIVDKNNNIILSIDGIDQNHCGDTLCIGKLEEQDDAFDSSRSIWYYHITYKDTEYCNHLFKKEDVPEDIENLIKAVNYVQKRTY